MLRIIVFNERKKKDRKKERMKEVKKETKAPYLINHVNVLHA